MSKTDLASLTQQTNIYILFVERDAEKWKSEWKNETNFCSKSHKQAKTTQWHIIFSGKNEKNMSG